MGIVDFVSAVVSDLALAPALYHVAQKKRHFELFIGIFQLLSAVMYNTSEALGAPLFINSIHWHFINDVTGLTYACCLLIHCMGNRSEWRNIALRYIAFGCAWIFKYRDSWDSIWWEAILILVFLSFAGYGFQVLDAKERSLFDYMSIQKGLGLAFFAISLLLIDVSMNLDINSHPFFIALLHLCAGGASYFLWKGIPSLDAYAKKINILNRWGTQLELKPNYFMSLSIK